MKLQTVENSNRLVYFDLSFILHVLIQTPDKVEHIYPFFITDPMTAIHKRLVFSGASSARQLQQFIELNVFHRQGFVYGAKEGKKFRMFVDDINLPKADADGVQRVNEVSI